MADGAPRSGLKVTVISRPQSLTTLAPAWQELFAASGQEIFNSPAWLLPWWQHLRGDRSVFVLVAHDSTGRARGLLPLCLNRARIGLRLQRRLGFLGDETVGSDYLDLIADPTWRPAVTQAFGEALVRNREAWDLIELRDLDSESETPRRLLAAMGSGFTGTSLTGLECPCTDLDPTRPFDEFLHRTRRRDNYLRRRKWLEKQPGFDIEIYRGGAGLERSLDAFFELHALRWQADGGSAGISGAAVEAFHRSAAAELAAAGKLRLFTLRVGEKAVASVYGLVHGATFSYYQSGMDPEWRSRSVGLVLIGETFADALRSGLTRYDFLRGEETYKADWTNDNRQLMSWRLFPCRGRGARAVRADAGWRAAKRAIKRFIGRRAA